MPTAPELPEGSVHAGDVYRQERKKAANQLDDSPLWKGDVTGKVESVKYGVTDQYIVTLTDLRGAWGGVEVWFNGKQWREPLSKLREGDVVTVSGESVGLALYQIDKAMVNATAIRK